MEAIFEAILGAIFEAVVAPLLTIISYLLLYLLAYVVCLPPLCLVCTPLVLICACFGSGTYKNKLISGYKGVLEGGFHYGGCIYF